MNIQQRGVLLNITGVSTMCYKVFYMTRWLKETKFCGEFRTLCEANYHIDWLQRKLPNSNKLAFIIKGNP